MNVKVFLFTFYYLFFLIFIYFCFIFFLQLLVGMPLKLQQVVYHTKLSGTACVKHKGNETT